MVLLFYTAYIIVDVAHHEIFRAKVDEGGIKTFTFGSLKTSTSALYLG